MLELVLTVCLLEDHSRCKDVGLVYMAESMTPMQCMMRSAPEIAKWQEGHPKWFAKKWFCRPSGTVAKI